MRSDNMSFRETCSRDGVCGVCRFACLWGVWGVDQGVCVVGWKQKRRFRWMCRGMKMGENGNKGRLSAIGFAKRLRHFDRGLKRMTDGDET